MSPKAGWYLNVETNKMKYWDGDAWIKKEEDETPPAPTTHFAAQKELSHKAIVAFVLSLIIPLAGWIIGIRAHREIKESEGKITGAPYATAAIWIGAVGTAIWVFILAAMLSFGGTHHELRVHAGFQRQGSFSRGFTFSGNGTGNFGGWGSQGFGGNHASVGQGTLGGAGGAISGHGGFGMMGGSRSSSGQGLAGNGVTGNGVTGNGFAGQGRANGMGQGVGQGGQAGQGQPKASN